jgi:NADPH-dependent 7-cyano-7-deazaguanine reductase QueF
LQPIAAKKKLKVVIVVAITKKIKAEIHIDYELFQPDTVQSEELNDFINLFKHAQKFANDKISTLTKKVSDYVSSKDHEYWLSIGPSGSEATISGI